MIKLQLFNLIDFVFGLMLATFGFFLYNKLGQTAFTDLDVAWLEWFSLGLGVLLLLSSFLSFCAITNSSCRWAIYPSSYIGLLIAIMSLVLGALVLALQPKIYSYLDNQGSQIGLSSTNVTIIKNWYDIIGYALFGVCAMQLWRYYSSQGFREQALRIDGEFDALLREEDKHFQDRFSANKSAREEKYDNLRSFYKNKYAAGGSGSPATDSSVRRESESQF